MELNASELGTSYLYSSGVIRTTHVIGFSIFGYGGDDEVVNNATGILDGSIILSGGNDTITNDGTIDGSVALGSGVDSITNSGRISGGVDLGSESATNMLLNSGSILGAIVSGSGADGFMNSGTITIAIGSIESGGGGDAFVNSGTIAIAGGNIELGDGSDFLQNFGSIQVSQISMGVADAVADTLYNAGYIQAPIYTGAGDDAFLNEGTLVGSVFMGNSSSGYDVVQNIGLVTGDIIFENGTSWHDGARGRVLGIIELGDGGDFLDGGEFADKGFGAAGIDILTGNGGDDSLDGVDNIDSLLRRFRQ